MRILIVSEDVPYPSMGGLAKHALVLARALVRAGNEVDFLGGSQHPIEVAGAEGQFGGRFFGELSGHLAGWKEHSLGVFLPPKRIWLARCFARRIMRRARDYDVTHYHGHIPNVASYIPADVNFVQTRHDQGSDCLIHIRFRDGEVCTRLDPADCAGCITTRPNSLQRVISSSAVDRYRRDVARAFRRHKTVFVSEMLRRNFARTAGPADWGAVVHNFVDLESLRAALAATRARSREESSGVEVFVAAKLWPPKGVTSFLRTLLPRLPRGMHVTIAGDGPDEPRLRSDYEGEHVKFLGWCAPDETLRLAANADRIVVPSVWEEPCATTVFEGLLLDKPTFALARGGTPELAIYARRADQLRLHADMESLVEDLVNFRPTDATRAELNGAGGVEYAIQRLLAIYRAPRSSIRS